MDLSFTLLALGAAIGAFAFASWRGARPTQFGKVRMIPWTLLSLIFGVLALFFLIHLVNLMGITTGRPTGFGR